MSLTLAGPVSGAFFAGNDHEWVFTVTIDGVAVDIGAMTCRFVMARPGGFPTVLSTEDTVPTAVATIGTTTGEFTIAVVSADTADLLGTYQYQAQVESAAGEKTNVLHGYFTFKENIIT